MSAEDPPHKNNQGFPVHLGNSNYSGGDTGLEAGRLYYCSRNLPERCRCVRNCRPVCGDRGGCPCESCVELVGFKVNGDGVLAKPGLLEGATKGGDTRLPPKKLFYCGGSKRNVCRCGSCKDKDKCGPSQGCPCSTCVELVGFKVNKDNVLARKGQIQGPWSNNAKSGGDTSMAAKDLYYCGKDKDECRCGSCDGVCGGSSGCPCNSCVELVGFKVNARGNLCKRGVVGGAGGDTGKSASTLYYCGKRRDQCRCSTCDGVCGPNNGCPCNDCVLLVGGHVTDDGELEWKSEESANEEDDSDNDSSDSDDKDSDEEEDDSSAVHDSTENDGDDVDDSDSDSDVRDDAEVARRQNIRLSGRAGPGTVPVPAAAVPAPPASSGYEAEAELVNTAGDPCRKGTPGGNGGNTGIDAGRLYYCGNRNVTCDCTDKSICDGICGPVGCPCCHCLELTFDLMLDNPNSTEKDDDDSASSAQDKTASNASTSGDPALDNEQFNCAICLERRKAYILIPCGHYSYCGECVVTLKDCAICRSKIVETVRVFDA